MKKRKILSLILFIISFVCIFCGLFLLKGREKKENRVIGEWFEESGMYFKFSNHSFYWYKDFMDLENNYYKGNIEIKNLCNFNLSKKELKKEYGDIDCHDYYEINLHPKILVSDEKKEKYDSSYALKFALYFEDKNTVYLYDFTKNKIYHVAKLDNF